MAHAIDRARSNVRSAHQRRQQVSALFQAAVVMEKLAIGALNEGFETTDLMCTPADVENRETRDPHCAAPELAQAVLDARHPGKLQR